MTTQALTLTAFLEARIAEKEASAPIIVTANEWRPAYERDGAWTLGDPPTGVLVNVRAAATAPDPRVLAECAVTRQIVERLVSRAAWDCGIAAHGKCDCAGDGGEHNRAIDARETLADLASVYADHPDYRDEWAL